MIDQRLKFYFRFEFFELKIMNSSEIATVEHNKATSFIAQWKYTVFWITENHQDRIKILITNSFALYCGNI